MQTEPLKPATTYPAIVGGVLMRIRNDNNLRQDELAQSVGVTQATWSRIEHGKSSITVDHLRKAAEKLGETPGTILSYADRTEVDFRTRGGDVIFTPGGIDNQKLALIATGTLLVLIAAVIVASNQAK